MPPADHEGVSLYVHVPVCARACPYCDFDFVVDRRPDVSALLAAYRREVAARRLFGIRPRTVYVGGGTPSALGLAGLSALLSALGAWFDLGGVEESTVEVNPEHADDRLFEALARGGVDRVSLGVQSFQDPVLALLGRVHTGAQARRAVVRAKSAGLRTSVDLIVGVPGAPAGATRADVRAVADLGPDHVSVYALTVEPDVPWQALVRRGRRGLPDPDAQADDLARAHALLERAGYEHYEVAGYARPGARSIHNLGYWSWRDYVGIGPSAASARHEGGGVVRRSNARGLSAYLAGAAPAVERLGPEAAAREAMWLGLRRLDGFDRTALARRFGQATTFVDGVLAPLVVSGLVVRAGPRVRLASGRWLFHDAAGRAILDPGGVEPEGDR